jgi:predicted RNA-binding protein with PIN domain
MSAVRTLIDGYNLMFELGLMDATRRMGPEGLRRARYRFLNELADRLGAVAAHQTTVVFDAANAPEDLPHEARHKGLTVVFAVEDETADDRIEALIAEHSFPKGLTVVSSDHQVQRAATRRKAHAVNSEEFWTSLEPVEKRRAASSTPGPPTAEERARAHGLTPEESAQWLDVFGEVATDPATSKALGDADFIPSDEEIGRIEREVEGEL